MLWVLLFLLTFHFARVCVVIAVVVDDAIVDVIVILKLLCGYCNVIIFRFCFFCSCHWRFGSCNSCYCRYWNCFCYFYYYPCYSCLPPLGVFAFVVRRIWSLTFSFSMHKRLQGLWFILCLHRKKLSFMQTFALVKSFLSHCRLWRFSVVCFIANSKTKKQKIREKCPRELASAIR